MSQPSTTDLEQKLARYGLMSLAALTALAAPANATVHVFSPSGGPQATPSSCGGLGTSYVYFQMTSNKAVATCTEGKPGSFTPDFNLRDDENRSVSIDGWNSSNTYMGAETHSSSTKVAELNAGAVISAGRVWGASETLFNSSSKGNWSGGQTGYVGVRFVSGGKTYYGWVNITVNSYKSVTLNQWGYEDSGGPILAGGTTDYVPPATPLPNSLLLLAAGFAGLAGYRKLRAQAQA
jgi:hypothetical protein